MATINAIRDALKTRLATISGLEVHDTPPGQITAPAAVIWRRNGPQEATFGGATYDYIFVVTVAVGVADDTSGQDDLDTYLTPTGASSIVQAINDDQDLGSTVEYCRVEDAERDQIIEYGGISYLSADVVVRIGSS